MDHMARVLVTGGASGIGAGTADLLSSGGWDVVRADVAPCDGVIELDISSHDGWLRVMDEIGPFDAVMNCAGIRKRVDLLDVTPEGWNQTLGVNLTGTFLGIQTFAKS